MYGRPAPTSQPYHTSFPLLGSLPLLQHSCATCKLSAGETRPPRAGATFAPALVGRVAGAVLLQRSVAFLVYSDLFRPSAVWAFAADAVAAAGVRFYWSWSGGRCPLPLLWRAFGWRAFCFPCGMHFAPPSGAFRVDNGHFIMPGP